MKRAAPTFLPVLFSLVAGCSQPQTEVLLVVTSDLEVPSELDHLSIRAYRATPDSGFQRTYDLTQTENRLPLSLGLLAGGDPTGPLYLEVVGLKGDVVVASYSASTSFVADQVRVFPVHLLAANLMISPGSDGGAADGGVDLVPSAPDAAPPSTGATDATDATDVSDARSAADSSGDAPTDHRPPAELPTITLGATSATPVQGYVGPESTTFEDACPSGSIVIGLDTATDSQFVAQLQPRCGVPRVSRDGETVLLTPSATLFVRGGIPGAPASAFCPRDQAVVGFDGRSYALLDQLSVRCAPLRVTEKTLSIGTPTNLEPVGGPGGLPFARTDCGEGMVAVGTNIAVRHWISAFGLVCAPIAAHCAACPP
jgi:hypothetical protein